jgi:hypothetical protein
MVGSRTRWSVVPVCRKSLPHPVASMLHAIERAAVASFAIADSVRVAFFDA